MKRLSFVLFAVLAVVLGGNAFAQGKYGADSAECVKYLDFYQSYYKQKNYTDALPHWRKAYQVCPGTARQNLFIHGTTMMTMLYAKTRDAAQKEAIVDTILTLQDQRLQFYPRTNKGEDQKYTILNNKGKYITKYRGGNARYVYDNLNGIIDDLGTGTHPDLLVFDLQSAVKLYQEDGLTADEVINTYNKTIACIDGAEAKNDEEAEQNVKARAQLESIFAESKVASCENIINIFGPRFEADPDNVALASTIARLMNTAEDCFSNDLYLNAVTSMHKNDPSHTSAYFLYKLHSSRGNVDQAIRYLEEAIAFESSDEATDAEYLYQLANFALNNKMKGKAYDAARKAADLDHGFAGKAYYLMGTIWGATSCGGNEIQRRSPYWVAVDYLQKAKAADPSLTDDANALIGRYSAYYPRIDEAFMYDISAGQSYTVSCGGMTATTTVRVSK